MLDRDALRNIKRDGIVYRQGFNTSGNYTGQDIRAAHEDHELTMQQNLAQWKVWETPHYADEVPPFDITITFMNEYGNMSDMAIYGVELTNEGMGLSVDDITTEKAMSFVARGLKDMYAHQYAGDKKHWRN